MDEAASGEGRLLAQIGAGDRAAFREVYARYSGSLLALALRMLGDRSEAEEALQDVFVRIWHGASDYDARLSQPFTWAVTITRRVCIDRLRRRRRRPSTVSLPSADVLTGHERSPRTAAVAHDDADRVERALKSLPLERRDALELALYTELSHAEIAERLAQPLGTVKSWIRRGMLELREALKGDPV